MSIVNILALGDSNTEYGQSDGTGWALKFRDGLTALFPGTTFNLVNKGVSGQNTQQLIDALPMQLAGQTPDIVAIMTGTNDAYVLGYTCTGDPLNYNIDPVWSLTDPNAINNYDTLLGTVVSTVQGLSSNPLVLLMSPPPAASYPDQINGTTIAGWAYTRPTRNIDLIVAKVAAKAGATLPYANVHEAIVSQAGWLNQGGSGYLIYDGVHLNPAGRQIAANTCVDAALPWLDRNGVVAGLYASINPATQTFGAATVDGTRRAGATIAITCSGATIGTVTYPTSTTWQCGLSGLPVGLNTVTATGSDGYGSDNRSITIVRNLVNTDCTPHLLTSTGLRPVRAYYKTPAGLVERTFKMVQ